MAILLENQCMGRQEDIKILAVAGFDLNVVIAPMPFGHII
jgi:hypothetical protein